jgi:hypothetical protein
LRIVERRGGCVDPYMPLDDLKVNRNRQHWLILLRMQG